MFDILVIGGGIHGVAVARDAALRGLTVLLIERGDLASGTSGHTSKLIHGGLRYLETGRLRLVRESLLEREILLETAPDFVRPLPFLLPHYERRGRSRRRVRFGLALYQAMAGRHAIGRTLEASAEAALEVAPGLEPSGLEGASLFADAQMDDAPLCVALALDAERAGAALRVHTEVVALARTLDGKSWRAHFRDRIEGLESEAEARAVVNAAGPWSDDLRRLALVNPVPALRRTRGTHVVAPVSVSDHGLLLTARRDGRVYFILPWAGHALIGTTDDDDARDPGAVGPRPEDVRYLVEEASAAVPGALAGIRPVRAFAGIRPLARGRAELPWMNSREHRILAEKGIWTIVGGKYTTHRRLAERVIDSVVRALRLKAAPCITARAPLRSGRDAAIARLRADFPRQVSLTGGFKLAEAEVVHAARAEKARRLDDLLLRRSRLWLDARALHEAAVPAAVWAAPVLGWSERTRASEVERLLGILDREERAIDEALGAPAPSVEPGRKARA